MLQQDEASDYVIGTGVAHTVRNFVKATFSHLDLDWREYVRVDSNLLRPAEVKHLVADSSKGRNVLGWEPEVNFQELTRMMAESDLGLIQNETETAGPAR